MSKRREPMTYRDVQEALTRIKENLMGNLEPPRPAKADISELVVIVEALTERCYGPVEKVQ